MFEYDELASQAAKILDKCNFSEEIERCKDLKIQDPHDVREYIALHYLWDIREELENLSIDEFMEYLTIRYNVRWQEVSYYKMH